MTAPSAPKPNVASLRDALIKHRLVAPAAQWELRPVAAGSTRREAWRRQHFQVITGGNVVCHVVTGRNLANEYRLAMDFYSTCTKLSCRPLFHHEEGNATDWIGFEHFPGTSLDERVTGGSLTSADWLSAVHRVQEALDATRRSSSPEALTVEVSSLIRETLALPALKEADRHLIQRYAQAILGSHGQTNRLSVRLTNGDFTGRNILMNNAGELRLIDYEFAAWTHFGSADWLRLARFSHLPAEAAVGLNNELVTAGTPANELYVCLHHFLQLQRVEPAELDTEQYAKACQRLLHALAPASLLVSETANEHKRNASALTERTAWAQSLENELTRTKTAFAEKDHELAQRTAWAAALDEQLRTAQANHTQLNTESENRLAWALSLDKELKETRLKMARLQQEFAERTAWAVALDKEVQATRSQRDRLADETSRLRISGQLGEIERLKLAAEHRALEQVRGTHEERAQALESERNRLLAELAGAQMRIDALVRELSSPTHQRTRHRVLP